MKPIKPWFPMWVLIVMAVVLGVGALAGGLLWPGYWPWWLAAACGAVVLGNGWRGQRRRVRRR